MKPPQHAEVDTSQRLRNEMRRAMRSAAAVNAVIRPTEAGWIIELSDGRNCAFSRDLCRSEDALMAAAVQWARRHGAGEIHIAC